MAASMRQYVTSRPRPLMTHVLSISERVRLYSAGYSLYVWSLIPRDCPPVASLSRRQATSVAPTGEVGTE